MKKGYENHPELRKLRAQQLRETIRNHPDKFPWNKGQISLPTGMTEDDVVEAYLETRSVHTAAKSCGISMHKAWRICSKAGVMRDPSLAQQERFQDPKEREKMRMDEYPKGENSPGWKGGQNLHNGYLVYSSGPNNGRPVHRVEMEQFLGRALNKSEIVHHINKKRDDNTFPTSEMEALPTPEKEKLARSGIGNLQLLTRTEHMVLHHVENNPQMLQLLRERFAI